MRLIKYFLSSQICTLLDFVVTITLSSFCGMYYVIATAMGSVSGGVANCMLNYKWVFPGTTSSKRNVFVKYMMVWMANIVLNTYGTYLVTEALKGSMFVAQLDNQYGDNIYILSKMLVAVATALLWTYPMQKTFVYRRV